MFSLFGDDGIKECRRALYTTMNTQSLAQSYVQKNGKYKKSIQQREERRAGKRGSKCLASYPPPIWAHRQRDRQGIDFTVAYFK